MRRPDFRQQSTVDIYEEAATPNPYWRAAPMMVQTPQYEDAIRMSYTPHRYSVANTPAAPHNYNMVQASQPGYSMVQASQPGYSMAQAPFTPARSVRTSYHMAGPDYAFANVRSPVYNTAQPGVYTPHGYAAAQSVPVTPDRHYSRIASRQPTQPRLRPPDVHQSARGDGRAAGGTPFHPASSSIRRSSASPRYHQDARNSSGVYTMAAPPSARSRF
jgi:hypothetical protein